MRARPEPINLPPANTSPLISSLPRDPTNLSLSHPGRLIQPHPNQKQPPPPTGPPPPPPQPTAPPPRRPSPSLDRLIQNHGSECHWPWWAISFSFADLLQTGWEPPRTGSLLQAPASGRELQGLLQGRVTTYLLSWTGFSDWWRRSAILTRTALGYCLCIYRL